jgi:hypothetical protein
LGVGWLRLDLCALLQTSESWQMILPNLPVDTCCLSFPLLSIPAVRTTTTRNFRNTNARITVVFAAQDDYWQDPGPRTPHGIPDIDDAAQPSLRKLSPLWTSTSTSTSTLHLSLDFRRPTRALFGASFRHPFSHDG